MVYLRVKRFKRKKDETERIYFYLVEAKRIEGKVQQKVLRYLGTAENILQVYKQFDHLKESKK